MSYSSYCILILMIMISTACTATSENNEADMSMNILINNQFNPGMNYSDTNENPNNPSDRYQESYCVSDINNPDYVPGVCEYTCPGQASIKGFACAPNGAPIIGAQISVKVTDCQGYTQRYEIETDDMGRYMIENVAVGEGVASLVAGSFSKDIMISLQDGELLDLSTEDACLESDTTRIAVIQGEYDSIESTLDQLGFEYELYCSNLENSYGSRALLGNAEKLAEYDILFINCGAFLNFDSPEGQVMAQNLKDFVANGGSLYASDLMAGAISAIWPDKVNFDLDFDPHAQNTEACCTCLDQCPDYCGAASLDEENFMCIGQMDFDQSFCFINWPYMGIEYAGTHQARIINPTLQNRLGKDRLELHFDLDGWVGIQNTDSDVESLVHADHPMMVRFPYQEGRVIYTSFHNEAQPSQDLQQILQAMVFEL